ncbi:hypothetical protein Lfu02_05260 [Longispora fulva]|uniref:Uncharacterized protein n=1 Tax=Longispora fulva TaxID=619741 RepID=A0A8J7GFJ1_9ACTN|nr:hypothetical protein [Longispora fulva]MBG6135607.1 hypothetical protein [Longispora fulva]GIG56154.1 hypothetical protein Lfu02_05260 [Longispora fulva]
MLPVTRADDELFSTVMAAARLGRAHKIVAKLSERYGQDWGDPLAGYPYALAMVALMQVELTSSGLDEQQAVANYSEIIESLGDLLYGVPEHWLGRYLRIRMRTMMMPPEHAEYPRFVVEERGRAAKDADELIARQAEADWQPWFAATYLLAARLLWESDDRDLGRIGELVAAAAARPGGPIGFRALGGLLREPFLWYLAQPGLPDHDKVARIMADLFPGA